MYDLTALHQATDTILEEAQQLPGDPFPSNPINWGDLRCLEASHVQTDDGRKYHRVVIEEASPECPEFCKYIAERLAESGFKGVEVLTEW